jgi:CheY-like chemotaxis protein
MGSQLQRDRRRLTERHTTSPHTRAARRSLTRRTSPAEPAWHIAQLAAEQPSPRPSAESALALLDRPPREQPANAHPDVARRRILVVEDDPKVVQMIRDGFDLAGDSSWALETTGAGRHALDVALSCPPDVVLLDVSLPDLDGAEVYRRLRTAPQTSGTRILFLTGDTAFELCRRGIYDGVLLRKPFNVEDLVGLVRALLAG